MATNLKEDIRPISYVKTNAADMMKYVNDVRNPVIITQNGEAKAVLLDIESYQEMQSAFSLLKIVQLSEREFATGKSKPAAAVFTALENRLGL